MEHSHRNIQSRAAPCISRRSESADHRARNQAARLATRWLGRPLRRPRTMLECRKA
jgi:hypothetical protein